MKCIALLLCVATCATAYVFITPQTYTSYYGGYSPIWRKKREAPAADQKADEALLYSSYYGYPYSSYTPYVHYLKKREAPAADQKADEALLYNNYYGYPYSAYTPYVHYLKKREAPEEKKAKEVKIVYSGFSGIPVYSYGSYMPFYFKK